MGRKQITPTGYKPIITKLWFRVSFCGQKWTVRLFSAKAFEKYIGSDCVGICQYEHRKNKRQFRTISFQGPRVCRDTIAHELTHAMLSYRDFSKSSPNSIEERVCEATGKHYKRLYKLTEMIYRRFRKAAYDRR